MCESFKVFISRTEEATYEATFNRENTCLPNESWHLYLEILPYHERMFFKMISLINAIYNFLWGDLVQIPLPGGSTLGISLLVMILVPAGIYFTIRTHFLPLRMFPEMIRITLENNKTKNSDGISGLQSDGRCGCHLRRRCRCCILDVAHCTFGRIYCLYRGDFGPNLQGKGSAVWWLPWWSGVLSPRTVRIKE